MAEASISKFTQELSGIKGQFKQVANESDRKIASISKDLAKHFNTQRSTISDISSNVEDIENKTQQLTSKIDSAVAVINNDMSVDNEILSTVKAILKYVESEEERSGASKTNGGGAASAILATKQGAKLGGMIGSATTAATQMLNDDISKGGSKYGEPSDAKGDNKQGEDSGSSSEKSKGDDKMTKITTKSGNAVQVHADYAKNFQGFIEELESNGYNIKSIGGYANRNIAGTGTASWHSKGMAIDINPDANPVTYGEPGRKPKTDMPENVGQIAAKYGLGWGGAWDGDKQDAMHFSIGEGPGAMLRGQRDKVGLGKSSGSGSGVASGGGGGAPSGGGGGSSGSKVAENKGGTESTPTENSGKAVEKPPIVKASLNETEQKAIKSVSEENRPPQPPADATPVKKEIPRLADVQERIKQEGTPDTFPGNSGGTFKKNADGSATLISAKGDKTDFTAEQYEREVAKRTWDKESKAAMISSDAAPAVTKAAVQTTAPAATPAAAAAVTKAAVQTTAPAATPAAAAAVTKAAVQTTAPAATPAAVQTTAPAATPAAVQTTAPAATPAAVQTTAPAAKTFAGPGKYDVASNQWKPYSSPDATKAAATETPSASDNAPQNELKPTKKEGGLLTAADIFPGHDPNSPGVKAAVARFQAKQIEKDPSLKTSGSDFAQLDSVEPIKPESKPATQAATINQAAENKELQMQQQVATNTPPENRQADTTVNNNYQTTQNDNDPSISWSEKLMGHFNMSQQVKTGMTDFSMFG